MSTNDTSYGQAGKALDDHLATIYDWLESLDAEISDGRGGDSGHLTEDDVLALINEHTSEGLTEADVIALINEHTDDSGGLTEEDVHEILENWEYEYECECECEFEFNDAFRQEVYRLIEQYVDDMSDDDGDSGFGDDDEFLAAFDERVIELINEHGAGIPEDRLAAIDAELQNIREAIGMVRGGVSSTIGPDVPDEGSEHSTPGWGIVLSIDEPRQFRDCTVVSNRSGPFVAELWEYDGDAGERVDHTEIQVISDGEHDVDLDLKAPAPGTYLLTRDLGEHDERRQEMGLDWDDYIDHPETEFAADISLWRTLENWDGWGRVDETLTLHNAAHPVFGGTPSYWYFFFSADVLPYYPDEDEE